MVSRTTRSMLKITEEQTPTTLRFRLSGQITGPWVEELRRAASEAAPARNRVLDLSEVTFIDAAGMRLLCDFHQQGFRITGCGPMMEAWSETITGKKRCRGRGHTGHALLAVAVLIAGISPMKAQPGPAPVRLTLSEAVKRALSSNPNVQIAILSVAEGRSNEEIARSQLLPQVGLRVGDGVIRGNVETSLGRTFPGIPQHIGPFWVTQAGASYTAPIFDLTLFRRYRASQQLTNAARSQSDSVREQYALLVVSQYLGALRATADVKAAESRVELAQSLYTLAGDMQRSGVGTRIDTLRANVELQNERQVLLTAQVARQTALHGLSRLLNLDPNQPVELTDEMDFRETPEVGIAESLKAAYQSRPELKQIASQIRALELEKAAAKSERYPRLVTSGGYRQEGLSPATVIPVYQFSAGIEMPLFTGGRIGAEVARAEIQIQKAQQAAQDLRNQIAFEVKNAVVQLESARHQVNVARQAVALATEEVQQARDRFQAGVTNNIEVITAQDELARANDNEIVALYGFNQARADLARAIGQIADLYTK
jgi:outer membrane protein